MMKIGVGVSVAYLLLLGTQIWYRLPSFYDLGLNEVGDFLAGALGPLSIFWLILSFKQQGDELKAQASEMASSVAEQKELVRVSSDQFKAAIDTLELQKRSLAMQYSPKIQIASVLSFNRDGKNIIHVRAHNFGQHARNFEMQVSGAFVLPLTPMTFHMLDADDDCVMEVVLEDWSSLGLLRFSTQYEDVFGFKYKSVFSVSSMDRTNELAITIHAREALVGE